MATLLKGAPVAAAMTEELTARTQKLIQAGVYSAGGRPAGGCGLSAQCGETLREDRN